MPVVAAGRRGGGGLPGGLLGALRGRAVPHVLPPPSVRVALGVPVAPDVPARPGVPADGVAPRRGRGLQRMVRVAACVRDRRDRLDDRRGHRLGSDRCDRLRRLRGRGVGLVHDVVVMNRCGTRVGARPLLRGGGCGLPQRGERQDRRLRCPRGPARRGLLRGRVRCAVEGPAEHELGQARGRQHRLAGHDAPQGCGVTHTCGQDQRGGAADHHEAQEGSQVFALDHECPRNIAKRDVLLVQPQREDYG